MNTILQVHDVNLNVEFEEHAIRLTNNTELSALLSGDRENSTSELVKTLKDNFHKLFNRDFDVSDESMAIEIWGHVYAERFADAVASATSIKLMDKVAEKIIYHSAMIDIGEKGYDYNRFVWDNLALIKSAISKLL